MKNYFNLLETYDFRQVKITNEDLFSNDGLYWPVIS